MLTKISNSQMLALQKCELQYYFAHIMRLKPVAPTEAIERGLQGHAVLEKFFWAVKEGTPAQEAYDNVLNMMEDVDPENWHIFKPISGFLQHVIEEGWEPVAVEDNFRHQEYVFTPDLVYRVAKGVRKGQLVMVDFKFSGRGFSERELQHFQQVPKYIAYWNIIHPNDKVVAAQLVILNTNKRAIKDLWKIEPLTVPRAKLDRIKFENDILLERTKQRDAELQKEGIDSAIRTLDFKNCGWCQFSDLCVMKQDGQNIDKMVAVNYKHNDYFDKYEDDGE